jgi:4-hydroxy-tetrahydrodipicolinate synthase
MMNINEVRGIFVPVVTPFDSRGELDLLSYRVYVDSLLKHPIQGLVVGGTTGESPTITLDELGRLFEATRQAMEACQKRITIILGTGTNDTRSTIHNTEYAKIIGADAALVVVPYYNKPSSKGILEHFRQTAKVGLPIIAYHVPYRTGVDLSVDTLQEILELDQVIGLKDSSGGVRLLLELAGRVNKPILCGEDMHFMASLSCGAKGGILASANIQTDRFATVFEAHFQGRWDHAKTEFDRLLPMIQLLFQEPNPAPVKWMLTREGLIESDTLRLPLTEISEILQSRLKALFP